MEENGEKTVVAKVGSLESDNIILDVKKFVNEVKRMKKEIKSNWTNIT